MVGDIHHWFKGGVFLYYSTVKKPEERQIALAPIGLPPSLLRLTSRREAEIPELRKFWTWCQKNCIMCSFDWYKTMLPLVESFIQATEDKVKKHDGTFAPCPSNLQDLGTEE